MNKLGQMGEGIMNVYYLMMVSAVALAVFGVSSIYYNYEIDVRDAEAIVLARQVSDCLSPSGVLDLGEISESDYGSILSYCGISWSERLYVGADVFDSSGGKVVKLYQGDSGALWVKELFGKVAEIGGLSGGATEKIEKYNPGYFYFEYPVFILKDGSKFDGNIKMEVLVNYEDE